MSSNLKKVDAGTRVSTYRVLARQALSLDIGSGGVEDFTIQGVDCRIAVQASHADVAKRRELGGSTLAIEFEADLDLDLFAAARYGFELLEDGRQRQKSPGLRAILRLPRERAQLRRLEIPAQ
jgi:hypothetical protein